MLSWCSRSRRARSVDAAVIEWKVSSHEAAALKGREQRRRRVDPVTDSPEIGYAGVPAGRLCLAATIGACRSAGRRSAAALGRRLPDGMPPDRQSLTKETLAAKQIDHPLSCVSSKVTSDVFTPAPSPMLGLSWGSD